MNVNLKPANDFAKGDNSHFEGSKLKALYNLIQSKNDVIEGIKNINKCLEFSNGEYVIERTGPAENFFPLCRSHYLLIVTRAKKSAL